MTETTTTADTATTKGRGWYLWLPILGLFGWLLFLVMQSQPNVAIAHPAGLDLPVESSMAILAHAPELQSPQVLLVPCNANEPPSLVSQHSQPVAGDALAIVNNSQTPVATETIAAAYLAPPSQTTADPQPSASSPRSLLVPPETVAPTALDKDSNKSRKVEVRINSPRRLALSIPPSAEPMAPVAKVESEIDGLRFEPVTPETRSTVAVPPRHPVQVSFGSGTTPTRLIASIAPNNAPPKGDDELDTLTFEAPDKIAMPSLELSEPKLLAPQLEEQPSRHESIAIVPPLAAEKPMLLPSTLTLSAPMDAPKLPIQAPSLPREEPITSEPKPILSAPKLQELTSHEPLLAKPLANDPMMSAPEALESGKTEVLKLDQKLPEVRDLASVAQESIVANSPRQLPKGEAKDSVTNSRGKKLEQINHFADEESPTTREEVTTSQRSIRDRTFEGSSQKAIVAELEQDVSVASRRLSDDKIRTSTARAPKNVVQIPHRGGAPLALPGRIERIEIADNEICESIAMGDGDYSLLGNRIGRTMATVWMEEAPAGQENPVKIEIEVQATWQATNAAPARNLKELQASVNRMHRDTRIEIKTNTDASITVTGSSGSEESAKQILNLIRKLCLVPVHDQVVVRTR